MANAYRTDANGKVIYEEGVKPFVPPTVAAPTPPGQSASNSDFWGVNSARPTNLAALAAGTYVNPASSGTAENQRAQAGILENNSNELDKLTVDPRDSATLSGLLTNLQNSANSVKTQTEADIKYIDEQANAAGQEYNDLIRQAQDEKRSGMAKNLVAAGERGGLLSSQYVGQAAQSPTEGGTFVGEGGDLAKRRDVYSLNISKLEGLKTQAIAAAKAAAAKFIKDGKQADFQIAKDLYDVAKGVVQDSLDLQYKNKQLDLQMKQEKRADTTSAYNIMKDIPEGQQVTINGETFTGIAVPDATKSFFSGSDIVSLMKEIPVGSYIDKKDPNTGEVYHIEGIASEDPNIKSVQATNDRGEVTITRYNQDTGAIISQNSLGKIGKTKSAPAAVNIFNQKSVYDGGTIPANIKTELLADINTNKRTMAEVMAAYPEVDTAYIQSLYPKAGITNPFAE